MISQPIGMRILTALVGGPLEVQEDAQRLMFKIAVSGGCGGVFAAMWLSGWTFISWKIAQQSSADLLTPAGIVGVTLMTAVELLVLGYVLACFGTRDVLILERDAVSWTRRVLVPLRRRRIALSAVYSIDMCELPKKLSTLPPQAIEIFGDGGHIVFAAGISTSILAQWTEQLRERFARLTHKQLSPASNMVKAQTELQIKTDRIVTASLASVGAKSEAELARDPERKRQAVQYARELISDEVVKAAAPSDQKPESVPRRVTSWFAALVWIAFSIVWIVSTVSLTARTIAQHRWSTFFLLAPFIFISILLAFFLWITLKVFISSAASGVQQFFRGRSK